MTRVHKTKTGDQSLSELEEFAYIVSHDLNAPVRHIKQFTELLCRRLEGKLEPEEQKFADVLMQSADNLRDMLAALLAFSHICTEEKKLQPIDLAPFLKTIVARCSKDVEYVETHIDILDLPQVTADRGQLGYVFEHLVENALKFHRENNPRTVQIGCKTIGDVHEFEISDNGVGIPDDQRERVFRFFTRLEPHSYAGLGVGLSISRKVIETHGGRMWAADAQNGASIKFTLPVIAAQPN